MNTNACIFCKILAGDAPADRVWEDDQVVVFLDRAPVSRGHCLVVPRDHHACIDDAPAATAGHVFRIGQRAARAVQSGLGAHGALLVMNDRVGQTVHHVHLHIIPRWHRDLLIPFRILWPIRRYRSAAVKHDTRTALAAAMQAEEHASRDEELDL